MLKVHAFVAFVLPLALLTSNADAAVLNVCVKGCQYSTIQSAVNAAASNDQIWIGKGIYAENVTIQGKTLLLDGVGSDRTIVDGSGASRPVFTLGPPTPTGTGTHHVTLQNMTITHGSTQKTGGGVLVRSGAALILRSSVVTGNNAWGAGGGIAIETPGGLISTIIDSTIESNSAEPPNSRGLASRGGGIFVDANSSLNLSDSVIRGNSTHAGGGGLSAEQGSQVTITRTTFQGNSADGYIFQGVSQGCGGAVAASAAMSIANSTMSENFADLGGGFCANSSVDKQIVTIEGTTISRNTAGGGQEDSGTLGAGLYAFNSATPHTTQITLDHVYMSQNNNITSNTEDEIFTVGAVKVIHTNTTIGDPVNSGCDGASCPK